jgi:hypothetical protein
VTPRSIADSSGAALSMHAERLNARRLSIQPRSQSSSLALFLNHCEHAEHPLISSTSSAALMPTTVLISRWSTWVAHGRRGTETQATLVLLLLSSKIFGNAIRMTLTDGRSNLGSVDLARRAQPRQARWSFEGGSNAVRIRDHL